MRLTAVILVLLFVLATATYGAFCVLAPNRSARETLYARAIPYRAVMAHRGASIVAPESTRPAYERARDLGADYLEADVQRTADGALVIFHDSDLRRTSNVAEVFPDRADREIGTFTLEELRQLDFGSWFNQASRLHARPEYVGLEILTLQDLIQIAREGAHTPGLILESKHPERYPGIEQEIIEVLLAEAWLRRGRDGSIYDVGAAHGTYTASDNDVYAPAETGPLGAAPVEIEDRGLVGSDLDATDGTRSVREAGMPGGGAPRANEGHFTRTIFFSFSLESLYAFQELAPDIPRLLLISESMISHRGWRRWLEWAEPVADGLGIKGFMAWPWHIAAAHQRGLFLYPYTINYLWQIRVLAQFQAAGFITDRPEMVLSFLNRSAKPPGINPGLGPEIPRQTEH